MDDNAELLTKIHDIEIDILKNIINICEKHNIKYFAIGGTLLGAVRHSGFIPWDDDIDIGMPREDYEKFKIVAKKELPPYLNIFDIYDSSHNENLFLKVHNINTTLIEKIFMGFKDRYTGVFVDVMPFDGMPSNNLSRNLYYKRMFLLIKCNIRKRMELNNRADYKHFLPRALFKKYIDKHGYLFFAKKIDKNRQKYKFEKSKFTCFSWSLRIKKLTFPRSIFDSLIDIKFENINIKCPKQYDEYLKIHYGDYMELPPVEDRKMHCQNGIIDLESSFIEYTK